MLREVALFSSLFSLHMAMVLWRDRIAVQSLSLRDRIVQEYGISQTPGIGSILQCLELCIRDDNCQSIFFLKDTKLCQTSSVAFLSGSRWLPANGSIHFTVTDDACPFSSGYIHNRASDLCYKIHDTNKLKWGDSRNVCLQEGGDLVVLNTVTKYDHIVRTVRASPSLSANNVGFYVGASNENTIPKWYWVNGDELNPESPMWGAGKPDSNVLVRYVRLSNQEQQGFDDTTPPSRFYFICEIAM